MNAPVSRWYREPMALFVFSLPLASVIAGLVTVWIAVQSADVKVADNVNRFGMQTGIEQPR